MATTGVAVENNRCLFFRYFVAEVWYVLERFVWREAGATTPLLYGSKV
jgi:hypothetical protein